MISMAEDSHPTDDERERPGSPPDGPSPRGTSVRRSLGRRDGTQPDARPLDEQLNDAGQTEADAQGGSSAGISDR